MSACRNRQRTRSASGGFSLFELLVVILIIGLISALVTPRMTASLPGVKLKSAARAVAASLRYARSRAVSESRPYIALFDGTQKRLAVEPVETRLDAVGSNDIRKILDMSELQNAYEFPDEIQFDVEDTRDADEGADLVPIFFFPGGDSTGAKIVLRNLRRKQYTITVDTITGRVKIGGM
jgi:general secretion pathway protein H